MFDVNQTFDETRQICAVGRNRDMNSMMMGLEVGSWNRGTPLGSWEREHREQRMRRSTRTRCRSMFVGLYVSPYPSLRVLPARQQQSRLTFA